MIEAINRVLKDFKKRGNSEAPTKITPEEVIIMKLVTELLQPCTEFTNLLQADGVTSSVAIVGLAHAIEGVRTK